MGTIGRQADVTIGGTDIQNILSCDINCTNELADDTTNDSNGYKEACYSDQQITLDITCKYDETGAAGIDKVLDAFFDRTTSNEYVAQPTTGGYTYTFDGLVSSLNISTTTSETIEVSFTVESTGTITFSG